MGVGVGWGLNVMLGAKDISHLTLTRGFNFELCQTYDGK